MVRLNKNSLAPTQINRLYYQLTSVITPKSDAALLSEILGTEEQLMIAKRLATIVLLLEGLSNYKIANQLKLSQSTIANIRSKLANGEYSAIQKSLGKNKKDYFKILQTIDDVLHLGGALPHYNGPGRYKIL